jgi:hypothetical protein
LVIGHVAINTIAGLVMTTEFICLQPAEHELFREATTLR